MHFDSCLTTTEVLAVFSEEIIARDGCIRDTYHDGRRLFLRSVLPCVEQVRPGDRVQGGVALKATDEQVGIYPYVFREVCRNGAIMAETLAVRSITDIACLEPEAVSRAIREGVEACCAPEVFMHSVRRIRGACNEPVARSLNFLAMISRLHSGTRKSLLRQIMKRLFDDGDQSQFGLANAITSVARDTQDPELRWNLEELGGGIAIRVVPTAPMDSGQATAEVCDEWVEV